MLSMSLAAWIPWLMTASCLANHLAESTVDADVDTLLEVGGLAAVGAGAPCNIATVFRVLLVNRYFREWLLKHFNTHDN